MDTRAHVTIDFHAMGVAATVYRRDGGGTFVYRPADGNTFPVWESVEPVTNVEPSMRLPDDVAKALLEGLLDHYRGGHDARQLRADYDAERKRVDKMLDNLLGGR